jgi:L-2-hydroxyglutarate oxidase LhgO
MKAPLKDIVKTNVYPVPTGGGIPTGVHFTPTVNERRGHQMIIGPGACLSFSREGYKFFDVKVGDLLDFLTNGHLWAFVAKNPVLSLSELWKDVNKAAFLREAARLTGARATVHATAIQKARVAPAAMVRRPARLITSASRVVGGVLDTPRRYRMDEGASELSAEFLGLRSAHKSTASPSANPPRA